MHREETLRTLPALLVLAVSGTTARADTAVMRPTAGAERIMDAKQVMRLAAIVRSTGYACQEGIFVAYKLPREAGRASDFMSMRAWATAHSAISACATTFCKFKTMQASWWSQDRDTARDQNSVSEEVNNPDAPRRRLRRKRLRVVIRMIPDCGRSRAQNAEVSMKVCH